MKLRLVLALGQCTVVALLLAGCASESKTDAHPPQNSEQQLQEKGPSFVPMDPGATHSVTNAGLRSFTLPDGRLEASAIVQNRENRRLQVQVQCLFKDGNGYSTGDETPWQTLILTENGMETVTFQSMNDKARNFTVRVREAR
jgi:uncharacterized protein YcfL